jgi:hypothetical protein
MGRIGTWIWAARTRAARSVARRGLPVGQVLRVSGRDGAVQARAGRPLTLATDEEQERERQVALQRPESSERGRPVTESESSGLRLLPERCSWARLQESKSDGSPPPITRDTTDSDVILPAMPAKTKTRRRQTPHGRRIDVARIVSVGQDRDTGEAVIRLGDANGKLVALCLPTR